MKVLVVAAPPMPESFTTAVRDRAVAALHDAGHDVDVCDLAAERFEARLGDAELRAQRSGAPLPADVVGLGERLLAAEALVFVYPTWWAGPPAVLKGWLDRVLAPGVAFDPVPDRDRVRGRLRNIRRIAVCTTHGSSKFVNALEGECGKRMFLRALRMLCHWRCRSRWVALYDIDHASREDCAAHLDRVAAAMTALDQSWVSGWGAALRRSAARRSADRRSAS